MCCVVINMSLYSFIFVHLSNCSDHMTNAGIYITADMAPNIYKNGFIWLVYTLCIRVHIYNLQSCQSICRGGGWFIVLHSTMT